MCSTQVKLTEYPPFCICALRDPYLLPSKETPAWRKQSSFNYLSPEQSPCDVIIPWQLSVQPHWPVSVAPSMVPTQWILIEWTSGMWKGKFFAIQHYKGIVSPFHHDTTDSTALEKKKNLVSSTTWKYCKHDWESQISFYEMFPWHCGKGRWLEAVQWPLPRGVHQAKTLQ